MDEEEKMNSIEEKPSKKKTMKARTKKYLAGFLVLMIVCTIVSRATASVTTPLVTVVTPKRGSLTYKVEGTGVIEASSEVFFPVQPEMKIDQIMVKTGDSVEEGQQLFSYDKKALKKKIEEADAALKASQNTYDKQVLNNSLKQDDSVSAQEKLSRAQEDYDAAADKLAEAKKEYEKKVKKIKEKLSKDQQEEYDTAKDAVDTAQDDYNTVNDTCKKTYNDAVKAVAAAEKAEEKALAAADEELTDAKDSLNEVTEKKDNILTLMETMARYGKLKDYAKYCEAKEKAYNEYFGKEAYSTMMKTLKAAQKELTQAQQDYAMLSQKWALTMDNNKKKMNSYEFSSEEYRNAYDSYQELILQRDEALVTAQRRIDTAQEAININDKYTALEDAAAAYYQDLSTTDDGVDDKIYKAFYDAIIDDTVLDQKAYTKAQALVTKKEEALKDITIEQKEAVEQAEAEVIVAKKDWEEKLAKEEKKVNKAKSKLEELLKKEYSGEDDIENAWATVESQQDAVKIAKRALEDASEEFELAQSNQPIQNKINGIDLEGLQDDIDAKQEILDELKKVEKNDGVVCSTVAGMISSFDVTQSMVATGTEKVSVVPTSCVFTGTFDKDDRKHVEEGETISCLLDTMEKSLDAEIVSIRFDQVNANYVFTATLPDGDYLPKTGGTYSYTKQSSKFDATIPLSALRSQNNKYYVLVLSETETVLGKETIAYRADVEVTSKDTQTAAVTGVYQEMQVITGSSRNIAEGDRVRVGAYE